MNNCTCHELDRPPVCQRRYVAGDCQRAWKWRHVRWIESHAGEILLLLGAICVSALFFV